MVSLNINLLNFAIYVPKKRAKRYGVIIIVVLVLLLILSGKMTTADALQLGQLLLVIFELLL